MQINEKAIMSEDENIDVGLEIGRAHVWTPVT